MTVIVTDADYRMTLPIIRDLVSGGHTVVATYRENNIGGKSRGVSACFRSDSPFEICRLYEKPVLLCVGRKTIEEVSAHKEKYRAVCHVLISDRGVIDRANDKASVLALAEELGIPVPKAPTKYPCVAKFTCGEKRGLSAERRYFVVKDEAEAQNLKAQYDDLIFQEKIEGDAIGVSVIMKDGAMQDFICHKRIRECPVSGGPSSCCQTYFDGHLLDCSVRLLKALGFEGVAMVEWKGGYLMEINPRVWGSYAMTRVSDGSFTMNWVAASCGEAVSPEKTKIGKKMKFFTSEAKLVSYHIKHGQPSAALSIIKDWLNPSVSDGVFEWGDLRGSFAYISSLRSRKNDN